MNDFLVSDTVDHGNGLLENALGGGFVTGYDRFTHTLDRGTQSRTQACVVGALLVCLTSALAGLCAVGHRILSKEVFTEARDYIEKPPFAQAEN
jgi:hypothetical protein